MPRHLSRWNRVNDEEQFPNSSCVLHPGYPRGSRDTLQACILRPLGQSSCEIGPTDENQSGRAARARPRPMHIGTALRWQSSPWLWGNGSPQGCGENNVCVMCHSRDLPDCHVGFSLPPSSGAGTVGAEAKSGGRGSPRSHPSLSSYELLQPQELVSQCQRGSLATASDTLSNSGLRAG